MQINIDGMMIEVKSLKYNNLLNCVNVDPSQETLTCSYSQCEGREFDPPPLHQQI